MPRPSDIVQPGHIFPLIAQPGGVLVRAGHTEACCDLARLAGLTPAAVICEIMNDDGTMARMPDLEVFAREHGLLIGTIADLIHHRSRTERLVERIAERPLSNAARRVPARRLSRQALRRHASRAGARSDLARHRDAGARARAAVGDGPARRRERKRTRGRFPAALAAIAEAGRGVVVLLHRPESAAELRRARDRRGAAADVEDGPAQLRHRRADPARPQRRPDAPAREAAQDAEHGGVRPRGDRLRRAARARACPVDAS